LLSHILPETLVIFDEVIEDSNHFAKLLKMREFTEGMSYIIVSKNIIKRVFECSKNVVLMRCVHPSDIEYIVDKISMTHSYFDNGYKLGTSLRHNYVLLMWLLPLILRTNIFHEHDYDENFIVT